MGLLGLHTKDKHYKQGVYRPRHPEKLLGKQTYAIYRSGLELKYFRILDENPNVLRWGSEEVTVPYMFEGKAHTYYIDLAVEFKVGSEIKRFLIELKPYRQTIKPVKTKRKREKTFLSEAYMYAKNKAKWDAATAFAKRKGLEFRVLTEKDLER